MTLNAVQTRAAIYARVSREEQVEGWSLDAQIRECRRFCESRGYSIDETLIWIDEGKSGKNTRRPAFEQMMRAAQEGRFDVIVCHKLDRFSRSIIDILLTLNDLGKRDIAFVSATEQFDFTSPIGKALLVMLAIFAEWYLNNLTVETSKGLQERFRQGRFNGPLCFGYTKDEVGKAIEHVKDADGVRLAFELYATGKYGDAAVAEQLNQAGYRTTGTHKRKGENTFTAETVSAMLRNTFYIGQLCYTGDKEKRKRKAERKVSVIQGEHAPIISQELFDQCLARRAAKRFQGKAVHTTIRPYLFGRKLAKCLACGESLRCEVNDGYPHIIYLRCTAVRRGIKCSARQTRIRAIFPTRQIHALITAIKLPQDWRDHVDTLMRQSPKPVDADTERRRIKERIRRLNVQFDLEAITDAEYSVRMAELKAKMHVLETISVAHQEVLDAGDLIQDMQVIWATATEQERSDLLHAMLSNITIDLDEMHIVDVQPKPPFVTLFRSIACLKETTTGCFAPPFVEQLEITPDDLP